MALKYDSLGYYEVLDLNYTATSEQIKRQYYDKAKFWHPDHNDDPKAVEIFQKVSVAYNVLKEENSCLKYDLLNLIYSEKEFPDINSLKVYKNQKDKDDAALRVLKQRKVKGNFVNAKITETKDICNISEAKDMVISTSVYNWLLGWWGVRAIKENIAAIKYNMKSCDADDFDNFKLLLHNALAYEQEKNIEMAWIYAKQAEMIAKPGTYANVLVKKYIETLEFVPNQTVVLPRWEAKELRIRQKIMPIAVIILCILLILSAFFGRGLIKFSNSDVKSYYSTIKFSDGSKIADDQSETHVIQVDVDYKDDTYLYHLKGEANVYYGPDRKYDLLKKGVDGQTVRVLGYTADGRWFKVMIDDGNTGFVHKSDLDKGIGNPVPSRSKIYKK